jgi:hypothetical protein
MRLERLELLLQATLTSGVAGLPSKAASTVSPATAV